MTQKERSKSEMKRLYAQGIEVLDPDIVHVPGYFRRGTDAALDKGDIPYPDNLSPASEASARGTCPHGTNYRRDCADCGRGLEKSAAQARDMQVNRCDDPYSAHGCCRIDGGAYASAHLEALVLLRQAKKKIHTALFLLGEK